MFLVMAQLQFFDLPEVVKLFVILILFYCLLLLLVQDYSQNQYQLRRLDLVLRLFLKLLL